MTPARSPSAPRSDMPDPVDSPLVTVIIPAFNAEDFIEEAVSSVLAQRVRDLEVFVVDDGSTDRTAEIAGSFTDPRVRVIRKPNGGVSSARNVGLRNAHGAGT